MNRKVIGIALAIAIVAAAVGVFFFFGPSLNLPGLTGGDEPAGDEEFLAVLTIVGVEGLAVTVSAEGSIAPRGEYEWDFGDGVFGGHIEHSKVVVTTLTATHTYAEPEAYIIALTVKEAETDGFSTFVDRARQLIEVGGTFVTAAVEQSTDGVNWRLEFTEVPVMEFSFSEVGLELYDANGVLLLEPTSVVALRTKTDGDVTSFGGFSFSVGEGVSISVSAYPAGTAYKLTLFELNWVLAEGTLDAVVPAPFTVSVAPAIGEIWVIQFTSVPTGMLATSVSIDIYQPNGIQLLAPTPITTLRGASLGNYFPIGDSLNVAVGDIIHLAAIQYPEFSTFRLLDNEASKVLVSGALRGFEPIGISLSQSANGLNWILIFAAVPADMEASSVFLSIFGADGSDAISPQELALSDLIGGGVIAYVPIVPSSPDINVGDRILLRVTAFSVGHTYLLTDLNGIILAQGTLA